MPFAPFPPRSALYLTHIEKLSCKDVQLRPLTSTKQTFLTQSKSQILCGPLVAISLLSPLALKLASLYHSNTRECKARIIQWGFVTKNNWRIPELTFMFEWFLCTNSWSKFPIRYIKNGIPTLSQLVDEKNSLLFLKMYGYVTCSSVTQGEKSSTMLLWWGQVSWLFLAWANSHKRKHSLPTAY